MPDAQDNTATAQAPTANPGGAPAAAQLPPAAAHEPEPQPVALPPTELAPSVAWPSVQTAQAEAAPVGRSADPLDDVLADIDRWSQMLSQPGSSVDMPSAMRLHFLPMLKQVAISCAAQGQYLRDQVYVTLGEHGELINEVMFGDVPDGSTLTQADADVLSRLIDAAKELAGAATAHTPEAAQQMAQVNEVIAQADRVLEGCQVIVDDDDDGDNELAVSTATSI